jgi:hypothetical protein
MLYGHSTGKSPFAMCLRLEEIRVLGSCEVSDRSFLYGVVRVMMMLFDEEY